MSFKFYGRDCYKWSYAVDRDVALHSEDVPHGSYDIWGMCRAYLSGRYNVSMPDMMPFANTFTEVITRGPKLFSSRVYWEGDGADATQNHINHGYLFLGAFNTDIYTSISSANIAAGGRQKKNHAVTASILWVKNAIYNGDVPPLAGWENEDIGVPGMAGGVEYDFVAAAFTSEGSGAGIDGTSDQFHFTYQSVAGDRTLVAQALSAPAAEPDALAGLMIRASNTADSAYVGVFVVPGGEVVMKSRSTASISDSTLASIAGQSLPVWLRLTRHENTFTGFYSTNKVDWVQLARISINMDEPVYAGLAVAAGTNAQLGTALFNDVKLAATVPWDGLSGVKIVGIFVLSTGIKLEWISLPGKKYRVEQSSDLLSDFREILGSDVTAIGSQASYVDSSAIEASKFYRIKLVP